MKLRGTFQLDDSKPFFDDSSDTERSEVALSISSSEFMKSGLPGQDWDVL